MKFARYLQDTQTPEWKKAYIDYRGLKVQLGLVRAQIPEHFDTSSSTRVTDVEHSHESAPNIEERYEGSAAHFNRGSTTSARIRSLWAPGTDPATNGLKNVNSHSAVQPIRRRTTNPNQESKQSSLTIFELGQNISGTSLSLADLPPHVGGTSIAPFQQTPLPLLAPRSPAVFPFSRDSAGFLTAPPLHTILFNLPATHIKFFDMLDAELQKVETFYAEREKEMQERAKQLREQLNELGIHRQMFHLSAHGESQNWAKKAQLSVPSMLASVTQWLHGPDTQNPGESYQIGVLASESGRGGRRGIFDTSNLGTPAIEHVRQSDDHSRSRKKEGTERDEAEKDSDGPSKSNTSSSLEALGESVRAPPGRSNSLSDRTKHFLEPHEYHHAKRRLRKAVIEHYRGLEVLNNYRILNLTGFRKALKKYEKITKNPVLDAYMKEKVEPSAFVSGVVVNTMLKEMEDLFAEQFERGDRKRAIDRLRVGPFSKTHHLSTFRSGLWLGLALPTVLGGFYLSFQENVRGSLSSWNILLFIYSVFFIPILLALLIGINIAVWAREKINYVFIFDLSPRSRLDHHEYFELPSFLLCTLAFAFWLSLAEIGPPMLWPLVWIALVFIVMFNPIRRLMWGHARWWTIKNTAKLGASGVWKVEFTDFWLGDQYCSLSYSLSNLFFVGCFYTRFISNFPMLTNPTPVEFAPSLYASSNSNVTIPHKLSYTAQNAFQSLTSAAYDARAQEAWGICGATRNWEWYYVLGVLPLLVRFIQSVRRYWDSRLHTHLINAGKYAIGMIYYFFYYYWRHQEEPRAGASYILWCFTASAYAIYACAWDFLMDWSLCQPHAQYPLLRRELIFKTQIPSYYFALISNICVRFIWLMYVPAGGLNFNVRTFFASMLEMMRRVQWNFYRLENEHLGNIDQYRVTREVPLPYNFEMHEEEHEEEENQSDSWWKRCLARSRGNGGQG